ncbi:MAG TPA: hypothetical protein VEA58_05385 [Anaerovoracaceae bacterium]|nr:hypothetical protein [Anaerovoracaceae bacterium]
MKVIAEAAFVVVFYTYFIIVLDVIHGCGFGRVLHFTVASLFYPGF